MNEKIRSIMEDVGLHIDYQNKEVTDKELDFFATTIVEACIEAVKNTNTTHAYTTFDKGIVDATITKSVKAIKEKFGMSNV